MADSSEYAEFLCVGPLPTDEGALREARERILADVEHLHAANRQVSAVFVLGTSGVRAAAEALLLDVQVECDSRGYAPVVIPLPGSDDMRRPAAPLLARSLTEDWARNAGDLWAGRLGDEVVTPLWTKVFEGMADWQAATAESRPTWHEGLLPGDGSLRIEVGGRTIGLVGVNSVFRMVAEEIDPLLAGCFAEQLDLAVGDNFTSWAGANDLTVLAAGHAGGIVAEFVAETAPLLKVAGRGEGMAHWEVIPAGSVRHRLFSARLGDGGVEVTDPAATRRVSTAVRASGVPRPRVPALVEDSYDEKSLLDAFHQNLSTGRMALAVISGPESPPLIGLDELNHHLAEAVFGAEPAAPYPLTETWTAAKTVLTVQQRARFLSELRAPEGDVSPTVHRLLRAPWYRIYDFTGSDLFERARDKDPDGISLVDACEEHAGDKQEALEIVAMHGLPSKNGDDVVQDFGDPDELPHGHPRRTWARRFRTELLERPVLFVSLSADSPALWDVLRMADRHRGGGEREFPGFLVSPESGVSGRTRLRLTGLQHIRLTPEDFATRQLVPGNQSLQRGRQLLAQEHAGATRQVGVQRVDQLVHDAPAGDVSFLLGRDPNWGDIKARKLTPRLSLYEDVLECSRSVADEPRPIVLVKGSAGTGKTTALMQLAYRMHQKGSHVGWVDRAAQLSSNSVIEQVRQQNLDAVFIDDIDLFKSGASSLMQRLNEDGKRLVVAAIRTSRDKEVPQRFPARIVDLNRDLTDEDLAALIKALEKNALIGALKQFRGQRRKLDQLRKMSGNGLLAAMIKAVTGSTLREKVISEFDDLAEHGQEFQWAYAVVCILNSEIVFRERDISTTSLLEIVSYPDPPSRSDQQAVRKLQEMGLLLAANGRIRCRQRTLADEVVKSALARRPLDLELVVTKLLVWYAERARYIDSDHHPDRRTLIRLLNHNVMRDLRLTVEAARRAYEAAHGLLHDDRHYWVQRAEFEIDSGDFPMALSYVQAGQGCPRGQGDRYLRTCSARLRLKWSAVDPTDVTRLEAAKQAVQDLHALVWGSEARISPHAFVALADDATRWLLRCSQTLGYQQYVDLLEQITDDVAHGEICEDRNDIDAATRRFKSQITKLQERVPGLPI
ncbi:ATP-binding protein [Streptomyces sp. NPDC001260]|uniref:ATP-binding protein n=1 Tax=Streptomyces sp. NPDC001260 TaxID=3364551 RepID=UPI00369437E6